MRLIIAFCAFWSLGLTNHATNHTSLPKLPLVFSAVVEANIVNRQRTVLMEEAYDFNQQTSFRKFYSNHHPNSSHSILTNYANHQQWSWWTGNFNESVWDCQVTGIHTFGRRTSSSSLPSINEFLSVGNDTQETYVGVMSARGIPCDVWSRTIVTPFSRGHTTDSFTLLYYFAQQPWAFYEPETRIPVRAVIRGVHNTTTGNTSFIYSFEHYYEFLKFEEPPRINFNLYQSPVRAEWTAICNTTSFCSNPAESSTAFCTAARGPTLPTLPNVFTMTSIGTDPHRKRSIWITESYDGNHETLHVDLIVPGHPTRHQFDKIRERESWRWSDHGNDCVLKPIPPNFNGSDQFVPLESGHLASPQHWLGLFRKPIWKGYTTVRGIDAEHWWTDVSGEANDSAKNVRWVWKGSYNLYFQQQDWLSPWNATSVPLRRDDYLDYWQYFINNGSLNMSGNVSRSYDIIQWIPNVIQDHHHHEIDTVWRKHKCDVSAYCAVYPNEDECVEPALPTLPNQFSARVDAVFTNKNRSLSYFEAYDYARNMFFSRSRTGAVQHSTYALLNDGVVYTWMNTNFNNVTTCNISGVSGASSDPSSFFGPGGHLKSTSQWYEFGKEFNETYMGQKIVRGYHTNYWHRRVVFSLIHHLPASGGPGSGPPPGNRPPGGGGPPPQPQPTTTGPQMANMSFDMYFYFTDPRFAHGIVAPVRIHVKGNSTYGVPHMFDHTYDFNDFQAGPRTETLVFNHFNPVHQKWVTLCDARSFCADTANAGKTVCTTGPVYVDAGATNCGGSLAGIPKCDCTTAVIASVFVTMGVLGCAFYIGYRYCEKQSSGHIRFEDENL